MGPRVYRDYRSVAALGKREQNGYASLPQILEIARLGFVIKTRFDNLFVFRSKIQLKIDMPDTVYLPYFIPNTTSKNVRLSMNYSKKVNCLLMMAPQKTKS